MTSLTGRAVLQKDARYENRKLLDIAHEAPCFLHIPEVCQSGVHPSVPAHSNSQRHGRGYAYKSHDCYVVAACGPCHDWLDKGKASREEKDDAFTAGWERYQLWLWQNNRVKVA